MITLTVKASKVYPIYIAQTDEFFPAEEFAGKKVCIVSDTNVAPLYLETYQNKLKGAAVYSYVIPAGESSKSAENYIKIQSFLAKNDFTRGDALIALGGGVVGDLTGFVASTYMRGIGYYQVPTSLLAMIDSSVGGKTAIDLPEGKNLVGSFYQPNGVYIALSALKTLPEQQLKNGMGELVKYAFLSDTVKREDLLGEITEELIEKCLKIKVNIVEADEKESGARMLLNLGHTVGHAIEALSSYEIPHGTCVAKGIPYAIRLSKAVYGLSDDVVYEMTELVKSAGIDLSVPYKKEELLPLIARDKKAKRDYVNFVLIPEIGKCKTEKIDFATLEQLL